MNLPPSTVSVQDFEVTLDNCAREPIHIPGRIQSHGVLVAFSADGRVSHRSANALQLLGALAPALGQPLADTCFAALPEVLDAVQECLDADGGDVNPIALEIELGGAMYELVGHRLGDRVIVELEQLLGDAEPGADHAFKGHRALNRLKRQRSIDELLAVAVEEVRALTGFDRVMAYRFRHDDSGDVVAESCSDAIEPFVGRRYPASDIPAQARRLYTINTLRNIADVGSQTVPVEAWSDAQGAAEPLDMSYCVLRGVSPVHIEYLGNLGVGASMSISVVVNGALWGMIACHHLTPRHVPYSVRSACDVVAQILAAHVQTLAARLLAQRAETASSVRSRAIELLLHGEDGVFSLMPQAHDLCDMFDAHGLVLAEQAKLATWGGVPPQAARQLVQWLSQTSAERQRPLAWAHTLVELPPPLREALGVWCGYLALRFSELTNGWVVLLRKEEIETIAWGGRPEKEYVHGPLGPRLTPRGSFEVWKEEVRGAAVPWSTADLDIGHDFMAELVRASVARSAELERARSHLLSMLSIGMERVSGPNAEDTNPGRPPGSRMQRLVSQVLDASRLQAGGDLGLRFDAVDLAALVKEVADEAAVAHDETRFIREMPKSLPIVADDARLREVIRGLISNARLHGAPGEPVLIQLQLRGDEIELDITNTAPPIDDDVAQTLFDPFRASVAVQAKAGLGLGLYIARNVARGHGGELVYAYADPYVMFSMRLPLKPPPVSPAA